MEIAEIIEELEKLPRETLVFKTIKGRKQPYLQWSEGGKTKSRYIKQSEREELIPKLERKAELKELYKKIAMKIIDKHDEIYYVSDIEKTYFTDDIVRNEQLISLKDSVGLYSVERDYINSKKYHDIFLELPFSHDVKERIYIEAGRLLDFVDGKHEEHMIAISARTGLLIADNLYRAGVSDHTSFNKAEYKKIQESEDSLVVLHNHSSNGRPSARDIITFSVEDKIKLSLVLCHDGAVYAICNSKKIVKEIFDDLLQKEKERWNDVDYAIIHATSVLYKLNDNLGKNQKLFEIRRF